MFLSPDVEKTTKRTGFGRDGEKHVELCLDAGQSFYSLALFPVNKYFRANVKRFTQSFFCIDTAKLQI